MFVWAVGILDCDVRLVSFDGQRSPCSACAVERQRVGRRGRADTPGKRPRAAQDLVEERHARRMREVAALLRIVRLRQPETRGQHVGRLESEIDVLQPPEAAHEQRGADEQHERQRELDDDQRRPQRPRPLDAPRPPSLSASLTSVFENCSAGSVPKTIAVVNVRIAVNASTCAVDHDLLTGAADRRRRARTALRPARR